MEQDPHINLLVPELLTLTDFKLFSQCEIDKFERLSGMRNNQDFKNRQVLQIIGNMLENLLQCLHEKDAKAILREKFDQVFGIKINFGNEVVLSNNQKEYFNNISEDDYYQTNIVASHLAKGSQDTLKRSRLKIMEKLTNEKSYVSTISPKNTSSAKIQVHFKKGLVSPQFLNKNRKATIQQQQVSQSIINNCSQASTFNQSFDINTNQKQSNTPVKMTTVSTIAQNLLLSQQTRPQLNVALENEILYQAILEKDNDEEGEQIEIKPQLGESEPTQLIVNIPYHNTNERKVIFSGKNTPEQTNNQKQTKQASNIQLKRHVEEVKETVEVKMTDESSHDLQILTQQTLSQQQNILDNKSKINVQRKDELNYDVKSSGAQKNFIQQSQNSHFLVQINEKNQQQQKYQQLTKPQKFLRDLQTIQSTNSTVNFHQTPVIKVGEYKFQTQGYTLTLRSVNSNKIFVCMDGQIDVVDAVSMQKVQTCCNNALKNVISGTVIKGNILCLGLLNNKFIVIKPLAENKFKQFTLTKVPNKIMEYTTAFKVIIGCESGVILIFDIRKLTIVSTCNLQRPRMIFDMKLVNEGTNEYAFATKAGVVLGNFVNNEDSTVTFTENLNEAYLVKESVENIFVIGNSHIVAFAGGNNEGQIIIIDRKTQKYINHINNEKGSKMQSVAEFDYINFPYVFIRNKNTLKLVDIVTNKSYTLISGIEVTNDWVFFLNNQQIDQNDKWQILITQLINKELGDKKLIKYLVDDDFEESMKLVHNAD